MDRVVELVLIGCITLPFLIVASIIFAIYEIKSEEKLIRNIKKKTIKDMKLELIEMEIELRKGYENG